MNCYFEELDIKTLNIFSTISTSILTDAMNRFNGFNLPRYSKSSSFFGQAFTVEEMEGSNFTSHLALKYIKQGNVLIINSKDTLNRASWGGIQTFMAYKKGVSAIIINGCARDLDEIEKYDIPFFALGISPLGPNKSWKGKICNPIAIKNVVINPGDIIVGDKDGIAVVPLVSYKDIVIKANEIISNEKEWIIKIKNGESMFDILGLKE